MNKVSFIQHVPGHKNSKGEAAPYVIKSHETGEILSSHKTKGEAESHLKQMQMHKHMKASDTTMEPEVCDMCGKVMLSSPSDPFKEFTRKICQSCANKLRAQSKEVTKETSLSLSAKMDVEKALKEVQEKTTKEINESTAYTWGSRAAACYKLAAEQSDERKRDQWLLRAEDFKHEALEHAALVEDGGRLVGEIQKLVNPEIGNSKEAVRETDRYPGSAFMYLDHMREWLKELSWANMEAEDFDRLPDNQIVRGIEEYYDGGLDQFLRDSVPVKVAKVDPTKFTSVLEDIVQKIQSDQPNLAVAKRLVIDTVQASGIRQEDKDTITRTVQDPQISHVMPISMRDQSSLVGYLFNSILKYKGLGVIKQENTIPYNGNRPQDVHPDPEEHQDEGYGGDRDGIWMEPRGQQMKAVIKSDLGTLKKGDIVVITASRKDKVFFFVEKDPSLVGVASRSSFEPYEQFYKRATATSFIQCHGTLSKSASFLSKLALDLGGLVDSAVIDQLESIKETVTTNKDRVVNQLSVSPQINASLRLADAAQYFGMKGVLPTEKETFQYIRASMAAHTNLPESTWPDEIIREAISNRKKADAPLDWSEKMMMMQQWHKAGKLSQGIWQELMQVLDSNDLNEIRVGIERLFDKASEVIQKPEAKTAAPIPPAPTTPPPAGKKYMWDAPSNQYVLVDASLKKAIEAPNTSEMTGPRGEACMCDHPKSKHDRKGCIGNLGACTCKKFVPSGKQYQYVGVPHPEGLGGTAAEKKK